jgi:opacity protein-like surface antigen
VGVGGGLVQVNQRVDGIDETGAVADNTFALRGNDLLFAYQVIVGLACPVNAHLRTSIDYRYSGTSRGNFAIFTGEDGLSSRLPVRSKLTSHRLMLGLTYFMK